MMEAVGVCHVPLKASTYPRVEDYCDRKKDGRRNIDY